ncbi:unnamed protein product [Paramecium sonneborni]|uniref:Uncharacterized protein n=1 Tax=Paramecium sonneborni TaxID=65129 RepID=A0A8S1RSY1_9CILI|nr:unnamed protein product [Paramecium sonneborni]
MDDNPCKIDQLKEVIFKYNQMEVELKTQIPDIVEVSIFQQQEQERKKIMQRQLENIEQIKENPNIEKFKISKNLLKKNFLMQLTNQKCKLRNA